MECVNDNIQYFVLALEDFVTVQTPLPGILAASLLQGKAEEGELGMSQDAKSRLNC